MALGTSGGGLAAICAAGLNGWERVVTVGCDDMKSHPNLMRCLEAAARSGSERNTGPEIRLIYSELVERDNEAALSVMQLYPAATKMVDNHVNRHNLLFPLYTQGLLPRFFTENFGPR